AGRCGSCSHSRQVPTACPARCETCFSLRTPYVRAVMRALRLTMTGLLAEPGFLLKDEAAQIVFLERQQRSFVVGQLIVFVHDAPGGRDPLHFKDERVKMSDVIAALDTLANLPKFFLFGLKIGSHDGRPEQKAIPKCSRCAERCRGGSPPSFRH